MGKRCFQVTRILVRAKELGIKQPILSGETAYTDKLLAAAGGSAKDLYVMGAAFDMEKPSQSLKGFLDEYQAIHKKKPGPYGCYTYDAVSLITSVIVKEKPKGGTELIEKIRSVKGYIGITGDITFDAKGDVKKVYRIYKVEKGSFKGAN